MVVYDTLCYCHGCNLPWYVNKENLLCSACNQKRIIEASSEKKEAEASLTDNEDEVVNSDN